MTTFGPSADAVSSGISRIRDTTCSKCGRHWTGLVECHCPSCHLHFSHVNNFDAHRVGTYAPDTRRCLTGEELAGLKTRNGRQILYASQGPYGLTWMRKA